MRTIDATLTSALAAGTGRPYLMGYIGYANGFVTHSGPVTRYKLTGSTLEFEMPYAGDIAGDQQCIWLERGLTISGAIYTVTTGRFRILSQHYLPNGHQVASGALFPKQYYSAAADNTYQDVIAAFCAHFGKTAVFRDPADAWLGYQFFLAGKSIILNDANRFANLLAQKYLIFCCDNGNEEVLFYSCAGPLNVPPDVTLAPVNDFFRDRSTRTSRCLLWRDESGSVHTAGSAADPLHNLGFLPSTADAPARRSAPYLFEARTRPDLRLMDGDVVQVSSNGSSSDAFALVTETFDAGARHGVPKWEAVVASNEVFANTEGGALPSTIERVSNYTPLNTGLFGGVLSSSDNNLQAAMDTLDDHTHAATDGYTLQGAVASFSPADSQTYYWGGLPAEVPTTTATRYRIKVPRDGTLTSVYCNWNSFGGTAGSNESITMNIRLNNTTSTPIATVGSANALKTFNNAGLSIAVSAGDSVELELVCPAWATNPTSVKLSAVVYVA